MSTLPVTARRHRPARSVFAFRGSVLGLQLLAHPGGSEEIKNAWVIGNQVTVKF